uniref:gamma-glutamylcyclotransferase n=1 Tax=Roseomonas chloroacetimidivorans TaxID=1766656 RepID=UPI003C70AF75
GAYVPHWVALHDSTGQVFGNGIAFTINRSGPQYAALPEDVVIQRLATAKGQLGTAAEYLFQTQAGLQQLGIQDPLIDHLTRAVTEEQRTGS